jgi:hypothetical protein
MNMGEVARFQVRERVIPFAVADVVWIYALLAAQTPPTIEGFVPRSRLMITTVEHNELS